MKALLLKIKSLIIKLFASAEAFLPIGIDVVNRFKKWIDSPGADLLTALIPGTLDDAVKIWLRQWLPVILKDFGDVQTIISLPKAAKNQVLLGIASTINQGLINNLTKESVTYSQTMIATETKYNETPA
jgi:hypothetical protein